jgi:uncharacterized membrane protein
MAFAYDSADPVQTRSGTHLAVSSNGAGGAPYATLALVPATSTITPEGSAVFSADIDDSFDLIAYAPAGWHVAVAGDGTITAQPGVGATAGDYTLLVTAQSQSHREIVATAEHTVTLAAHEALEFNVNPEPNLSIPMSLAVSEEVSNQTNDGEAETPDAAYRIELRNLSTMAKAFTLSVSGAPAGWIVLDGLEQTSAQVTLAPGAQTMVGLYVAPPTLPAPGTSFTMDVQVSDGGSLADGVSIPWSMPGQAFNHLTVEPEAIYVSPNSSADFSLAMTNVGNVAGTFPISATLWLSAATISNLQSPISLAVGESQVQVPTLDVADLPLGTRFPLILGSPAPDSYTQYALVDVQVVSEHSGPIFEAAYRAGGACALDDGGLAAALEALALAVNDLEQSCAEGDCDLAQRDRVVAAAESAASYGRLASPLLTADETLDAIAADLSTHSDDADIEADIAALAALAADLETEMCETAEHAPAAGFTPYLEAALPGQTVTYTLDVENRGSLVTTYAITLELATGTSSFTETINPGDTFTAPVSVATTTLALHTLQADVVVVGLPLVADSAEAHLNVVDRLVQVTAVHADPAFVETGTSSTTLSVDVANVANVPREANARTTILAPTSSTSWTADISLTILASSPRSYELGTVDTSGWAAGVYTITVALLDSAEALIPDGSGYGYLGIGQALGAAHALEPGVVPPGTVTVTTIVTTEILADTIGDEESLLLTHSKTPRAGVKARPGVSSASSVNVYPPTPPSEVPVDMAIVLSTEQPGDPSSQLPDPQPGAAGIEAISIGGVFTRTEENEAAMVYTGAWGQAGQALASGGTYRYADDPGDTATFTFYGDWVNVGFIEQSDCGRAKIYVDQAYLGPFDLYSSPAMTQTLSFENLGTGAHILRVESYRDRLTFDAFKSPGASPFYTPTVETGIIRYEEDDPLWLYNGVPYTRTATTWTRTNSNVADRSSGDQVIGSNTAADVVQITVSGEWLNLGFGADWNSGQAEVFLDGVSQGTIDLYRRERGVVNQVFAGLADTSHTISVTVSGDGEVWIDYLDVWDGSALPNGTFKDYPDGGYYRSGGWGYYAYPQVHWYSDNGTIWFPFGGDTVSYNYLASTNSGLVRIYLDEQYQGVFDLYGSTAQTQTLSFDGLGAGAHVLRLEQYRGRATLESFKTPGTPPFYTPPVKTGVIRYEEDDPALRYNGVPYTQTVTTWSISNNPNYGSSAYYAQSSTVSDTVSLSFEGTWFGVGFLTHDYGGQADIYLDGAWLRTVDLYTNEPDTASYYFDGLPDASHTVSVTVLSTAHPNSRGHRVRFDYFDVWDGTAMSQGTFEESSERLIYSGGWGFGSSAAASGGAYAGDDGANNGTVWFPFTGESVAYQPLAYYQTHQVVVKIDGVSQGIVDIYSSETTTRTFSFDGLGAGPHVLEVRAYRADTTVDAFITPGSPPWYTPPSPSGIIRYEEDNPALVYNGYPFTQTVYTWSPGEYAYWVSSNGWVAATGAAGAWVSLDFSGTWVGAGFTKSTGVARVLIDGSPVVTLDLSLESYVTNVYFDDLISGSHTISVERVSGSVYFDFFDTWDGTDMGDGWFEAKLDDHRGPYHYNTLSRWYTKYPDYNVPRLQYARDADVLARRFPPGYPTHLWFTFTGDDLLFLPFQSNGGSTKVFIDGVSQGVFDLTPEYSTQPYALHFQDLGEGPHVACVDASIAYVDAFQVDPPNALPYTPQVEWMDTAPTDYYSSTYNSGLVSSVGIGDLEGDGIVELVVPAANGQMYVYRGDGQDAGGGSPILWQTGLVGSAAEPALADLDGDGDAEIIVFGSDGTAAFHHDGSTYWFTDTIKSAKSEGGYWGWGGPSIGNVDAEPGPEIVLATHEGGLYILDYDGTELYYTPLGSLPTIPVLADLTADGILDILYSQGTTLTLMDYYNGANIEWTRTITYSGYGLHTFGSPAVAEVDGKQPGGDDGPEVIINWGPVVDVLDEDGTLLWNYDFGYSYWAPSPITIADVDGDGEIEILTASALHSGFHELEHTLIVLNADGTLLWQQSMGDTTASASGVATQDLDGDGIWEVLWNGLHEGFTIMNGPDGTKLFNEQFTESGTILDYPTLGDVDGDGFAEVVTGGANGLFVIGHDGIWTMSRPIWNQHNYHITNINDDWSVPANEPNSWEVHNTYRTQTPKRTPAPSYQVRLTYTAGITGVLVLTDTASVTLTATPPDYAWSYRQDWYEPVLTTTFDSRLTDMRPGEARLVAQGTEVVYRLPSGLNRLTLPPLYASTPHIVTVEPASQTAALGGIAVYTVTLSNPAASSDVYTLSVAGLPAGWAMYPPTVTLPAEAEVTVPLTVSVPTGADPATLAFSVLAANSAGGTDQATASLQTFDAFDLALSPASVATTGLSGVFTLTLTNLDDAPQTIHLAASGLADVSLPASVVVPGDTTASLPITATATVNGPHPFTITGTGSETGASDRADAVLEILGRRGVAVGLSPAAGVGGPGTPAVYTLSVANTGTLSNTYDLAASLPPGWSYRLEANGAEVAGLSLPPYIFNAADLLLIVTPANGAAPGFYAISATAQSWANPVVSAAVTASLEVTARGVDVDIQPQSGSIDPTHVNTWQVTVTNLGTLADTYALTATGLVALSAQFTPETVSLNPGQSQAVQLAASDLSFALPGTYEFAVWARSQADVRIQNEDRAEFTLSGYEAVEAAWIPTSQTVTDTLSATFLLVVTNTGNLLTTYQFAVDAPSLSSELLIGKAPIPPSTVAALPVTMRATTSGIYTIEGLAISDSGLASASTTTTLTIVLPEEPLSVDAGPDQAADEGSPLGFGGSTNKPESSLAAIHWNLGDGATITGTLTPTHTYADDGAYLVTLTVTDTLGASASDDLTVTVSNVAPLVTAGPDQIVGVGQPVSFSGVFTDAGVLDVHTIEWAFGDGIVVSGTLTPTHTYGQSDLYTVTLTVTDDDGGEGNDSLVVTVECSNYLVYLPIVVRQR